ncbi:hypothetical protein BKA82DRAFT_7044 [Pisolithus tinctorius]|uniref:Uncharacterized protein n=1 Tax=Pisolithus tinctorius Marx 270 TaxID=870435 RepID=A0A0C3PR19_PISTI|nr:hypothetical protein BKA82DRAFT_7044 [Pisolithus tinctorius]KIO11466.1 hypothetical protein M404DRAFT_7044 [Pisolithus tinctorius Marx 270]
MSKIVEISMIMAAIQGQGIDLNNKIKALILVHSMSQAWEQAPVNILSSIVADQLRPDTVIPRMKEVWSHKSGKTMLPQQEKPSTSGAIIILKIINLEEDLLIEEVMVVKVKEVLVMAGEDLLLIRHSSNNNNNRILVIKTRIKIIAEAKAADDFDITAIEQEREPSPEYSPTPPAVENVYSSDLGTFLGSHMIGEATAYDPDLTQQDIDMAMSNVRNSQTYPIDGSTGELSSWFLDEIQGSFHD